MKNIDIIAFIDELKVRTDVLGIILFGSWARGNNRPNSDVDLVVILTEGYRRTVEYKNKQAFEIIYTTASGAMNFWKSNINDCYGVWSVAKILYDKDESIKKLKEEAQEIIKQGKKLIDEYQIGQFTFSAEDQLSFVEMAMDTDPATANFVLAETIASLTELFFDLRMLWTPAPKQRLEEIKKLNIELYKLLEVFYIQGDTLKDKIEIAKKILPKVFKL